MANEGEEFSRQGKRWGYDPVAGGSPPFHRMSMAGALGTRKLLVQDLELRKRSWLEVRSGSPLHRERCKHSCVSGTQLRGNQQSEVTEEIRKIGFKTRKQGRAQRRERTIF